MGQTESSCGRSSSNAGSSASSKCVAKTSSGSFSSSMLDCCTRRPDGRACCDLNDSLFGEDAFYRDAFYDCDEGNRSHDWLFAHAREQARLKMRKGSVFVKYASFELSHTQAAGAVTSALARCISTEGVQEEEEARALSARLQFESQTDRASWLGKTIPQWTQKGLPETGVGPYWSKAEGEGLKVRCGPNYRQKGLKAESKGSMYEAISCDTIRGDTKIENIVTGFTGGQLPPLPENFGESDRGGGGALQWTRDCPLPRVICINMMLPYTTGVVPMRPDAGCSFVGFFHIRPQTIRDIQSKDPSPAAQLFKKFWEGPAGEPGGPATNPDRCLFKRVNKKAKKDQQAGLFKVIAHCVNPEDVHVPEMFHTYNGKPCLITKCGYIIKDPNREWLEIGIDVRGFNILARRMLCSFRQLLPRTKIHYGFLVQGIEDEELPEGLLCDMYLHGVDMMDDPVDVSKDAAGSSGGKTPGVDRTPGAAK